MNDIPAEPRAKDGAVATRAAALAAAHPGTDVESAREALSWIEGGDDDAPASAGGGVARTRGLGALASLPPRAVLEATGLSHIPQAAAEAAKKLILSALGADPFRSPERPLSPAVEARAERGIDFSHDAADEAHAPSVDVRAAVAARGAAPLLPAAAAAALGGDRPWTLLARAGGLDALGGLFALPPEISHGPEETLLALEPGRRALLLRIDARGVEIVREMAARGAASAAWHPRLGLLRLLADGTVVDGAGDVVARGKTLPPARLLVQGEHIFLHSQSDMQLLRAGADGRFATAMDESASAVAIGPGPRIVALLRSPRAKALAAAGKKAPSHRLARMTSSGPETIGAIDGEGEVALLGDVAFHVSREEGRLTIADMAVGAIRRIGRLPGGAEVRSLVATGRALLCAGSRSGWIRAFGPAAIAPAPGPSAPEGTEAGTLTPLEAPPGVIALAGRFVVCEGGRVLRVVPSEEGPTPGVRFEEGARPIRLGRAIRTAAPTPEGGFTAVPLDGSPILEVTPDGDVRSLPFPSTRVIGAVRFGDGALAIGTTDGDLSWIDLRRGVLAELRYTALRALAPVGRDLAVLHEGGLERLHAPGMGVPIHGLAPILRSIGGGRDGAIAASGAGLIRFGRDGARAAQRKASINRDPMLSLLGPGRALVVQKGGQEGLLWST